jgi:hypothetical protein
VLLVAGGGFREAGFSKERRLEPQITLGLLTDAAGFPLTVAAFEGNKGGKPLQPQMVNGSAVPSGWRTQMFQAADSSVSDVCADGSNLPARSHSLSWSLEVAASRR